MKFQVAFLLSLAVAPSSAFAPSAFGVVSTSSVRVADVTLAAKIRGPTDKSEELRFGEFAHKTTSTQIPRNI